MNSKRTSQEIWEKHIEEWRASGKSGRAWTKEQNLSYQTFLYWKKRFLKKYVPSSPFVELVDSPVKSSFIELIVFDIIVRVPSGFDPSTLKSCLQLLREESCSP